ncbi:MAG: universal stress protein [Acidobacteriota bacterium]
MSFRGGLKTVVVATDLHGEAEAALEYAGKLAGAYGARIVLAHGLDPLEYAAIDDVPEQVLDELSQQARNVLAKLSGDLLAEGIRSHSEIRQGDVVQTLVDVARDYQAGLIVLGSKGREGAGPVLVGAITERLVRTAPCPVLAVSADWNAGPYRPTPGGPVLLAIERNEAASEAARTAYSLAETFHRHLLILHVRTPAEATAFLNPCSTRIEDYGIRSGGSVVVDCIVKDGHTANAILETVTQRHPSILVIGVKRTSHTPGPHGTAFTLLAGSRVPVLCVPPPPESQRAQQEEVVAVEM